MSRQRTSYTRKDQQRAARLYRLPPRGPGLSTEEIGEVMDVPGSTIWRWLDAMGLTRSRSKACRQSRSARQKRRRTAERAAWAKGLREDHDLTHREIAEHMGCSRQSVTYYLNKEDEI